MQPFITFSCLRISSTSMILRVRMSWMFLWRIPQEISCDTCGSSTRTNQCLTKNCVYKIKCSHCDTVYIGETSRTIGSRIKEHIRMVKQTVYSHLIKHNKPSMQDISWGTLHRNIHDIRTRKIIEALEIRKHENVMNGCNGRALNLD